MAWLSRRSFARPKTQKIQNKISFLNDIFNLLKNKIIKISKIMFLVLDNFLNYGMKMMRKILSVKSHKSVISMKRSSDSWEHNYPGGASENEPP